MEDKIKILADSNLESSLQSLKVMEKLAESARPEAVFSEPVEMSGKKVITASEISLGLGFGFGFGSGPHLRTNLEESSNELEEETGMGSGGGGGGGAGARPVAVITLEGDQVTVQPILDLTKISLAFLTMLGSIFVLGSRMKQRKQ
ncbi:MAG: spore germination protein GerW family protein [Anaerolineales bacterium]|jgi:uncharacterized spore protein YtfJ